MANPYPSGFDNYLCSCTAMRKASRRLSQMYDAALAPTGLRNTQYSILHHLKQSDGEPPLIRDLAETMVMDRSTLGQNLLLLERDGLVRLDPSCIDRRSKHVVLTPEGQQRYAKARPLWREVQDRFEAHFGDVETAYLRKILLGIAVDTRLTQPTSVSQAKRA